MIDVVMKIINTYQKEKLLIAKISSCYYLSDGYYSIWLYFPDKTPIIEYKHYTIDSDSVKFQEVLEKMFYKEISKL